MGVIEDMTGNASSSSTGIRRGMSIRATTIATRIATTGVDKDDRGLPSLT
jgi:hypothetical protein